MRNVSAVNLLNQSTRLQDLLVLTVGCRHGAASNHVMRNVKQQLGRPVVLSRPRQLTVSVENPALYPRTNWQQNTIDDDQDIFTNLLTQ